MMLDTVYTLLVSCLHCLLSRWTVYEDLYCVQVIVEKAENGDTDHIKHALDLFVDFAAIFVRILVIMLQNAEKREERRDSRKRRN